MKSKAHMRRIREFQSTHPHGVRLSSHLTVERSICFNPRTHTGCDKAKCKPSMNHAKFQSTHPHGVRLMCFTIKQISNVSIHAPTRGATLRASACFGASLFQSTHPHGVRPNRLPMLIINPKFQSTHPHGVRQIAKLRVEEAVRFQSTHPHGVRRIGQDFWLANRSFNPRTHTGCDGRGLPLRHRI